MGWGRMLLLGDFGQQMDIQEARDALERMRHSAAQGEETDRRQDELINRLSDENEQLKLCLVTLVRLLVAKGAVSGDDVREILNVVDPPEARPGDEVSSDDLIALARAAKRHQQPPRD